MNPFFVTTFKIFLFDSAVLHLHYCILGLDFLIFVSLKPRSAPSTDLCPFSFVSSWLLFFLNGYFDRTIGTLFSFSVLCVFSFMTLSLYVIILHSGVFSHCIFQFLILSSALSVLLNSLKSCLSSYCV